MKLNIKKSRLEIHRTTKEKALEYLEYIPEELKDYQKGVERLKTHDYSIVEFERLIKTIESSNVIYLGDFHTFDQSSKNLERLLKTFFTKKNDIILGVEFVHIKNQTFIDDYLNNIITEREFLESINYKESWRFPWIHYKTFFELAKKNNFKIIALNSEGTLAQRDREAAKVINSKLNPDFQGHFFILFGELHILPERLPKMTKDLAPFEIKQVIIHQNLEEIYWRIYDENEGMASQSIVVQISESEFSLQNSPPWIKYESMIYWYENLCDDPEFDLHDYIIETGLKSFNGNIYENFYYICKQLNDTLEFNLENEELEDFNIYDHRSLELILEKINKFGHDEKTKDFLQELIHQGEIFNIPSTNLYYCSSYSINRISILAGFHIFNLILNKATLPSNKENILCYFTFMNYLGYFSSKVFNPFRKCDLYIDLVKKSKGHSEDSWQIICLKLLRGDNVDDLINNLSLLDIFKIGKQAGNIIAELSFFSNTENNFIFDRIINYSINRSFEVKNLTTIINELVIQTPNFYQKTKAVL